MRMDLWHRVFSLAKDISGPLGRLTAIFMALCLLPLISLPPDFFEQPIGLIMLSVGLALFLALMTIPLMITRMGMQRLNGESEMYYLKPVRPLVKAFGRSLIVLLLASIPFLIMSLFTALAATNFSTDVVTTLLVANGIISTILIGYIGLRLLPYAMAPLANHEVPMAASWRLTSGRTISYLLPLIIAFVLSTALDYLWMYLGGGLFFTIVMVVLRALMYIFLCLYCAVAYDEMTREPVAASNPFWRRGPESFY